jgi:predicted ribosome quality control (RQC) complex YloA/Tae2 family protein
MVKKNISSFEVLALVNEMKFLIHGKVSQIYHLNRKEFLFQLHARREGKKLLKIYSGKWLHFTSKKETPMNPTGFCMQLRKYLSNAIIKDIYQKNSERIICFVFEKFDRLEEKKKEYFLYVELFSKGNVVFTDDKDNIFGVLNRQVRGDKKLQAKTKYEFPKAGFDWKNSKLKEFSKQLLNSDKKNLSTALATDLSLGGVYAKELCLRQNIDLQSNISDINEGDAKNLYFELQQIIKELNVPAGYIYDSEVSPIKLFDRKIKTKYETYSQALDSLVLVEIVSPYQQKITQIKKIIEKQTLATGKIEKTIIKHTQSGEEVYKYYPQIKKLLGIVTEMKKTKTWQEIKTELEKETKIIKINLKDKKILLDL